MAELLHSLNIILFALREDNTFKSDMLQNAPAIYDEIHSYCTNPSCTCKSVIIQWINNNAETVNSLLQKNSAIITEMAAKMQKQKEEMQKTLKERTTGQVPTRPFVDTMLRDPKNRIGHIITIDRNKQAYSDLIHQSIKEGWRYKGCTIIPDKEGDREVWNVFFY
jgi:hypothetical protein